VGHDVTGEELVAASGRLGLGAVVRQQQKRPEATGVLDQSLDLLDGVLGCADDGGPEHAEALRSPTLDGRRR
jgi:hypothetical protein